MEKRSFSRVPYHTEAEIVVGNQVVPGTIENLSLKGVFFRTSSSLPLNESINLVLLIPGTTPEKKLTIPGRVARKDHHGVGLEFQEVDYDVFCHLKNIVIYGTGTDEATLSELVRYGEKKTGPDQTTP